MERREVPQYGTLMSGCAGCAGCAGCCSCAACFLTPWPDLEATMVLGMAGVAGVF